jgi:hypothetical protein
MGCDSGQGYLMSRPIPANEFGPWSLRWTLGNTARRKPASASAQANGQDLPAEIGEDA